MFEHIGDLLSDFITDPAGLIVLLLAIWLFYKNFESFKSYIEEKITLIEGDIKDLINRVGFLEGYTQSKSPKQITEKGYKLLKTVGAEDKLKDCPLLADLSLKSKDYIDLFKICNKWIKENKGRLILETRLNSTLNEEQSSEILSLFLMEKIKKSSPHK